MLNNLILILSNDAGGFWWFPCLFHNKHFNQLIIQYSFEIKLLLFTLKDCFFPMTLVPKNKLYVYKFIQQYTESAYEPTLCNLVNGKALTQYSLTCHLLLVNFYYNIWLAA